MKKLIPSFLKSLLWQFYLRIKHGKGNKIAKGVILSKDFCCGKNCVLGRNSVIGQKVKLGNGVRIGEGAKIERIELGDNSILEGMTIITGFGDGLIKIGKESFIGHNTVLDFSDNITIGDFVHIGYSQFWTHSSAKQAFNGIPINNKDKKFRPTAPIEIGNNSYIGVHSTIYPGVKIGHHSIVAPNSAVTKNVEPYTMVGGVPAHKIKDLKTTREN
jgi:acetyltransferase-like isoleucine patch superfamily enzyme